MKFNNLEENYNPLETLVNKDLMDILNINMEQFLLINNLDILLNKELTLTTPPNHHRTVIQSLHSSSTTQFKNLQLITLL